MSKQPNLNQNSHNVTVSGREHGCELGGPRGNRVSRKGSEPLRCTEDDVIGSGKAGRPAHCSSTGPLVHSGPATPPSLGPVTDPGRYG